MKHHECHASLRFLNMAAICDLEVTKVGCLESICRRIVAIYPILIVYLNFMKDSEGNKVSYL